MKYAQKLEANKHADWPYIDYRGVKKVISTAIKAEIRLCLDAASLPSKAAALRAPLLTSGGLEDDAEAPTILTVQQQPTDGRDLFLQKLREQRNLVQAFYMAEFERHHESLRLLVAQFEMPSPMPPSIAGRSMSPPLIRPPVTKSAARTHASLARAATDLYRTLQHLRNYAILNYTGLLKLAKKYDKKYEEALEEERCKAAARGGDILVAPSPLLSEWTAEVSASPFVAPEELEELCTQLEKAFAYAYCEGSVQEARATLLVRKVRPNSTLILSLGLRSGLAIGLVAWFVWDLIIDSYVLHLGDWRYKAAERQVWLTTQLPLFRAGGALVITQFLWALCLHIWNKARINFEFMLDFGPKMNTSALLAASIAMRTCIFYLLSLLLFTKALIGELPRNITPGVPAVAMCLLTFGSLLAQNGRTLLASIACVLAAPFHPVDFASVLIGDVLTSMVKPLQDVVYALCYISTSEFLLPYSDQGYCHSSWRFYHQILVPLLCAIPLWCRFMQCLRVAHDSGRRWPALPNALKYSISLLVVIFGEMHPTLVQVGTPWTPSYPPTQS